MANNNQAPVRGPWSQWSGSATADNCDFGRRDGTDRADSSTVVGNANVAAKLVALPRPFVTIVGGGICIIRTQNTPWRTGDEGDDYTARLSGKRYDKFHWILLRHNSRLKHTIVIT